MSPDKKEHWLVSISKAVGMAVGVDLRSEEEAARDLKMGKIALANRLKQFQPPVGATEKELDRLRQQRAEIAQLIQQATDEPRLLIIGDAIDDFEEAVAEVEEAIKKRTEEGDEDDESSDEEAMDVPVTKEEPKTPKGPTLEELVQEVRKRLDEVYDANKKPESLKDALPNELTGVAVARQKVLDILGGDLTEEGVKQAGQLVSTVVAEVENAGKAVVSRLKVEAEKVGNDGLLTEEIHADAEESEKNPVLLARKGVTDLLRPDGLDAEKIEKARGLLTTAVEPALKLARETVRKRLDGRANEIRTDPAMEGDPLAGASEEDMKPVREARQKVKKTLEKESVSNQDILAAEKLLTVAKEEVQKVKETVQKRDEEAKSILGAESMKAAVAGTDEPGGDLKDLDGKRELVQNALKPPLSATSIEQANTLLQGVGQALAAAKEVVVQRRKAADELLDAVNGDPLKDDPAGAMKKQKERLLAARALVKSKLSTSPLSKTALEEATKAKETLAKLHKGVIDAVAKGGGASALTQLATEVGDTNIEALETAFGAEDPEKLVALLADLGGKDSIKTLLAKFSVEELKTTCDALGGAKHAEAVLRAGCGGDAAKMKKMVGAFGTKEEKKDLQDLVEKGGLKPDDLAHVLKASFGAADLKAKKAKALKTTPPPKLDTVTLDVGEQDLADQAALTQIKSLVTTFKGEDDRKRLANLLDAGGLGGNPAMLGTLLQTGCGGDAAKLKTFTDGYPVPDPELLKTSDVDAVRQKKNLDDLKGVLSRGGLGENPAVFGGLLASGCDGDPTKVQTFCAAFATEEDRDKLRALTRGGLGGGDGEAPERLGVVYKEGLGSDPAKLKELHEGFAGGAPPGADLLKFKTTMDAFDAPPPPAPPSMVGKRLENVRGNLKSPPAKLETLRTKFYKGIMAGPHGGVRAAQESLASDPTTQAAMGHSGKAAKLAADNAGIPETVNAGKAAQAATRVAAAAALAGPGVAPELVQAAAAGAEAAGKAAELSVDPAAAAKRAYAAHELAVTKSGVNLTSTKLKEEADKLALAANNAAKLARDAAILAATKAASTTPPATPAEIKDAADKAKDAADKAALATDPTVVKETLAAATQAAQAAADAAAKGVVAQAKTNRTAKAADAAKKAADAGDAAAMRYAAADADEGPGEVTKAGTDNNKLAAAVAAAAKAAAAAALLLAKAVNPPETTVTTPAQTAKTEAAATGSGNPVNKHNKAKAAVVAAAQAVKAAQLKLDPSDAKGAAALAATGVSSATAITAPTTALPTLATQIAKAAKDVAAAAKPLGKAADLAASDQAMEEAGQAALANAVADDPVAMEALVQASLDEAAAIHTAAMPGATPEEIKKARAAAALSAAAATKATAAAAKTQADSLRTALATPGAAADIAAVTAAGTAAYAASLATDDPTSRTQARDAAVLAYDKAVLSGQGVVVAAGDSLPPERWAAGAAYMQRCKVTQGLFDSNNAAPPMSTKELMRVASTLQKKHLVLNHPADTPALSKGGMSNDAETRMDHVCERHTRTHFTFDPEELTPKEQLLEGLIAEGALKNVPKSGAQKKAIAKASAKNTTMFPEGTEKGDIKAYIEEAVTELFAKGTGTYADIKGATLITAGALTWNFPTDVNKQFGQYKSIPIANGLKFTIGLANQGGTHYKVTQFYPEPPDDRLETVNPGDMHTAKDALGV